MINENLEQSIEILEKDGLFISNIKSIITSTSNPAATQDEVSANVKKAHSLILHILDYYVTVSLIDMDADLLRLCIDKPLQAKRLSRTLNNVGITLKQNYQYLCKEGTLYNEGLPLFKYYYSLALQTAINETVIASTVPNFVVEFKDIEFIKTADKTTRMKKLELLSKIEFDLESIKRFIDSSLSWADKIENYLARAGSNRTILDMDDTILMSIYDFCGKNVFSQSSTPEDFAKAIKNIKTPTFQVQEKDHFYALVLAIYNSLGSLAPRDAWRDEVLKAFELNPANYRSAKSRIESEDKEKAKKTKKLKDLYNNILEIIQRGK